MSSRLEESSNYFSDYVSLLTNCLKELESFSQSSDNDQFVSRQTELEFFIKRSSTSIKSYMLIGNEEPFHGIVDFAIKSIIKKTKLFTKDCEVRDRNVVSAFNQLAEYQTRISGNLAG